MARQYLLSIDGGGIRGIIPAVALAKLENTTGQLARDTFSFVAGTSTGAIIAAAIVAGIPATRIVDLYVNRASEVFTGPPLLNILQRIISGSMYSTQKLHDLIGEEIGSARDWSLNDSPVDLLITAKGVPNGKPWYFVKDAPANSRCTGRLGLVDCVTASAAAPTYFWPWTLDEGPLPSGCEPAGELVDGGVGVMGNPVYQACVEAFFYKTTRTGTSPERQRPFRWAQGARSYPSGYRAGSDRGLSGCWANYSNLRGSSKRKSPGATSSRSQKLSGR